MFLLRRETLAVYTHCRAGDLCVEILDRQMCLSNICIQLRVMEMRLLDSSALPPELYKRWKVECRRLVVGLGVAATKDGIFCDSAPLH